MLGHCYLSLQRRCRRLIYFKRRHAKYITLIGGPGSGKGTLAVALSPALGLAHLGMGDIFRREIAGKTELGKQVLEAVAAGVLVPDETTIQALLPDLSKSEYNRGAVLDGVPRTKGQAQLLDQELARWGHDVELAIRLDVPKADLLERLELRRTCTKCGRTYHLKWNPSRVPGICDAILTVEGQKVDCGGTLEQRRDDKPGPINKRLAEYDEAVTPLSDYYQAAGKLIVVTASNSLSKDDVFRVAMEQLRQMES